MEQTHVKLRWVLTVREPDATLLLLCNQWSGSKNSWTHATLAFWWQPRCFDLVNYCTNCVVVCYCNCRKSSLSTSTLGHVWSVFRLWKKNSLWLFSLTPQEVLMEVMENETWTHSSYVPHYLLRGDPFASRLSKEADIVAAFYICIIGQWMGIRHCGLICVLREKPILNALFLKTSRRTC